MNWTHSLMHELGSIYSVTQVQKHFSVMVRVDDCYESNLGSVPGQGIFSGEINFC